jgi:hypothetical protein
MVTVSSISKQISTTNSDFKDNKLHPRLLFLPLRHRYGRTFITFHMSTVFPPPRSRRWAKLPGNLNLCRRSAHFTCPFSLPFRRHKATCSVFNSLLASWTSASPFHSFLSHHLLFCTASQRRLQFTALCRQHYVGRVSMFSSISVFDTCNRRHIHTSCRTASTFPFRPIPDISYGTNPTFNSGPHSLETISAMFVLGRVWSLEIV